MEAVPTAGGPAGHHADDDLRHEADQALAPRGCAGARPRPGSIVSARLALGVLVAVRPRMRWSPPRAERPAAVLRRRTVAGQEHAADVGRHPGVVERAVELVDGVRAEGVADLGPVEGDADGAVVDGPVVGDVGEVEAGDLVPAGRVEELRDDSCSFGHRPMLADPVPCAHARTLRSTSDRPAVASFRRRGLPEIEPGADLAAGIVDAAAASGARWPTATSWSSRPRSCRRRRAARSSWTTCEPSAFATEWAGSWDKDPRVVEVVLRESKRVVRQIGPVLITETQHGFVCANSGVDQSSSGAHGRVLAAPDRPRRVGAPLPLPVRGAGRRRRGRDHRHVRPAVARRTDRHRHRRGRHAAAAQLHRRGRPARPRVPGAGDLCRRTNSPLPPNW